MRKIIERIKNSRQFSAIKQHWKPVAACVFCFPFAIYASMVILGFRIGYELDGPYEGDSLIYFTVGRGILNGIVPWSGLFETKPPGIFLLSALSFKLFDSPVLAHCFQALAVLLTAVVPVAAAFLQSNYRSVLKLGFAMLAGAMLALYSDERAGLVLAESFGAAFACIAVFAMAMPAQDFEKRKILWTSLSVIGILGACGFKEPFLFPIFGASLVLCANIKAWAFRFAMPLAIAVLIGVIFLLACGWLDAYLHYLSYMSSSFISNMPVPSTFGRALEIDRLFYDLNALSWGFAIAVFILILFLPFALPAKIALLGAALLLASFAVGVGGYYPKHHYVLALPFYMALVLLLLKNWEGENSAASKLGLASFVFLAIAVFNYPNAKSHAYEKDGYMFGYNRVEFWYNRMKFLYDNQQQAMQTAAYLDSKMDELGIDRYAHISGGGYDFISGYTKHSPEGPFFFYSDFFLNSIPGYADSLLSALERADIIVAASHTWMAQREAKMKMWRTLDAVLPWLQQNLNDYHFEQVGSHRIYIRKNRMPKPPE